MKKRECFVSNSSSSSFIIPIKLLTETQILQIEMHARLAKDLNLDNWDDPWHIDRDLQDGEPVIKGTTWLDNFSMSSFFEIIGVSDNIVEWHD